MTSMKVARASARACRREGAVEELGEGDDEVLLSGGRVIDEVGVGGRHRHRDLGVQGVATSPHGIPSRLAGTPAAAARWDRALHALAEGGHGRLRLLEPGTVCFASRAWRSKAV